MSKKIKLLSPLDGETDVLLQPTLTWDVSPGSPVNVIATSLEATSPMWNVTLAWDITGDAVSYNLYLNDEFVQNISGITFDFLNVLGSVNSEFGVSAVNVNGNESGISYLSITPSAI